MIYKELLSKTASRVSTCENNLIVSGQTVDNTLQLNQNGGGRIDIPLPETESGFPIPYNVTIGDVDSLIMGDSHIEARYINEILYIFGIWDMPTATNKIEISLPQGIFLPSTDLSSENIGTEFYDYIRDRPITITDCNLSGRNLNITIDSPFINSVQIPLVLKVGRL